MNRIKICVLLLFAAITIAALGAQTLSYPPFVAKAKKFGAKDCTFCHVDPEGGPPFNARGLWLISEKDRRSADAVDPEWLSDYKPGKGEPKDATAATTDKKPDHAPQLVSAAKKVDPKVFGDYVGDYELPMFTLTIIKEGDRLFGQPQGDTREELVPDSENEFTVTNVNAKVKFVRDDKGKVTAMVVNLNGQEIQGKKIK